MTIIILSITLMIITIAYLHQIAKTINQETTIKELKSKLHDINVASYKPTIKDLTGFSELIIEGE